MSQSVRLLVILMALSLALIPATAWARYHWSYGDERYWAVDDEQVCRDGVEVYAFNQSSTIPNGGLEPAPISVVARLYENQDLTPPNESGQSDYPFATYGPLLSPSYSFTMTYHSEPWLPSFTEQPGNIYLYNNGYLRWYYPLEPGTRLIIHSSFSGTMLEVEVADCYLDPPDLFTVSVGSSTLDQAYLDTGYGMRFLSNTFFLLDSLPAHGEILMNGSPLEIGEPFTRADITDERLRYVHDGSETSEDSFAFHVEQTILVSLDSAGNRGNLDSTSPTLAADARYVAFASNATNLVNNDSNGVSDIFMHDLDSRQTTRVSVSGAGTQADSASAAPQLSAAFGYPTTYQSTAANLVSGDCLLFGGEDGAQDIFLRSFPLKRASVTPIFYGKCYQANRNSYDPSIAAYDQDVAFVSDATNLLLSVDNDDNVLGTVDDNGFQDVYVRNPADIILLVSIPNGESEVAPTVLSNGPSSAPSISADGDLVAFQSDANNLVAADGNGVSDIFVHSSGETKRVSVHTSGAEANAGASDPAISGNGRFVAFESAATNLVTPASNGNRHIFVRDLDNNRTTQISLASDGTQGNDDSHYAAISYNGRYIAFLSEADNLVENDTNEEADVFVRDRDTDGDGIFDEPGQVQTTRVSVAKNGAESDGPAQGKPTISSDGHVVAFASDADNLVTNDINENPDIFVHFTGESNVFRLQILPRGLYLPSVAR